MTHPVAKAVTKAVSKSMADLIFHGRHRPPIGQLGPLPWRSWPQTVRLVGALTADGQEVRFIGGCVRDGLLNRPPHDIDLATPDTPEQVMELLGRAAIKAIPTGLSHGTVTAVLAPHHFEITTLRRDVATDGRHALVQWTNDWQADAARRDFTINALSARPDDGAVYDYFNGIEHLARGQVVFIGRAQDRVQEDYLRILRFFRFQSRFGRLPANPEALAACTAFSHKLVELSGERVRDEILKILAQDDAATMILLMRGARVLDGILPEAHAMGDLRQMVFLETRALPGDHPLNLSVDPLRRLAAVLGPTLGDGVAVRWRLSNADTDRLLTMQMAVNQWPALPAANEAARRATLHRLGVNTARDALLLAWARERALNGRVDTALTQRNSDFLAEMAAWDDPPFPLKGRDLEALGVTAGREMGVLLAGLEDWWTDRGCVDDHATTLAEARRRVSR